MTDRAAIMAQLVDIRNLGTEKCVKLTLHVPAEQAAIVLDAFGWPTAVAPVPVAVARLKPEASREHQEPPQDKLLAFHRARKSVSPDKRLAQQAGILCADIVFQQFLYEHEMIPEKSEEQSTLAVRLICGVQSRSDILPGTPAAIKWDELCGKFEAWRVA